MRPGQRREILHSYGAATYQPLFAAGRQESSFDSDEQVLFQAFALISDRARSGGFRTRMFRHNLGLRGTLDESGRPNARHPSRWVKWPVPEAILQPFDERPHPARVTFEHGVVLPSFETWLETRTDDEGRS